jgi:YidC/Oxa1 family membrane protein insertase
VHFYTGLPWWATLLIVPFVTRAVFFPMQIKVSKIQDKIVEMNPELQVLFSDIHFFSRS